MREYTVREIEALRAACENKVVWNWYAGPLYTGGRSQSAHIPRDAATKTEEMVRTYMLANKTAADLFDSERAERDSMNSLLQGKLA